MKRTKILVLTVLLMIGSLFLVSSCEKDNYEKVDPTDTEYFDYEDEFKQDKYDEKYNLHYGEVGIKAYFGSSDSYKDITGVYSDEVFFRPSNQYNHFLAKMSMGMALASYTVEYGYITSSDADLQAFLYLTGFNNLRMDEYSQETSLYTVASLIGSKKIVQDEEEVTLVAVGIRSGKYKKEWMSNFTVEGDDGLHGGFDHASKLVVDRTLSYIEQNNITGKIKIWITGFSRGAAIANLTAGKLNAVKHIGKENIYAYTFATPRGVAYEREIEDYDNIFNILGPSDPVTQFAPSDWGFCRFGHDIYLPGSEYNSAFSKVYSKVQEGVGGFGFETYYSAGLNLRIRLLLGHLAEFAGYDTLYTAYTEAEFVSLVGNKSLDNIFVSLKSIIEKYHYFTDDFDPESLDRLIDFILSIALPLFSKNGYLSGESGTATNAFRLLMHEHYPELYYYMLYSCEPEELFFDNNKFAYVLLDQKAEYELYHNNQLVLSIDTKGNKTLTDYAKEKSWDLQVISFDKTKVLVLPYDQDYELKYLNAKSDIGIRYVEYGREFTSNLEMKTKKYGAGSGSILKVESNVVNDTTFKKEEIKSSSFASILNINKIGFTWKINLIIIVAVIVLLMSIIPILAYLVYTLINKSKFRYLTVINIVLLAVICCEEELSYWFFSYSWFLYFFWKALLTIGIVLSFILFKKDKKIKIFDSLIPFVILGVVGIFAIDKNSLIASIAFALSTIYLFIYLFRQEKLQTKQIAIASMVTIILEIINIRVIKCNLSFGLAMCVMIPLLALIFLMVSNKDHKIRTITYLFIISMLLLGVFYSFNNIVISHLLFKVALYASFICAAFMNIQFNKMVPDEIGESNIPEFNQEIIEVN